MSGLRLLNVPKRLTVTAPVVNREVCLSDAGGGLATGLRPYHEHSGGLRVGWPGDVSRMTLDQRHGFERQLRNRAVVPGAWPRDHVEREVGRILREVVMAARTLDSPTNETVSSLGAGQEGVCLVGIDDS